MPIYENGLFSKPAHRDLINTRYRLGVDFYQNLYNGNKLNLKTAAGKVLHQMALLDHDQTLSDIRYKTATLYLELQKTLIFRDLINKHIADQEKQLKEIRAFHKNGMVLKSDVLRVELDLSKRKMALLTIENDITLIRQQLNIIIGEPDDRLIMPADPQTTQDSTVQYEQYLSAALQHSFLYKKAEQHTALSRIKVNQLKANTKPKAGIYGSFYYANPQLLLYPYAPHLYSLGIIGLRVSFPLSELYHNAPKLRAAKLEQEKEEEAYKDAEDKIRLQVKEAFLRYKEALANIAVAKENVANAEENARIIKNTYLNHTSLITDLLDADMQVLQTRFELAAAGIMAQNKYFLLQNISGVL
jgi:outer membrane protein TolC